MLCPNCGTATAAEHKFCRTCGMNLEPVTRAMAAHLGDDDTDTQPLKEEERRAFRRMTIGLIRGLVLLLAGVLLIVWSRPHTVPLDTIIIMAGVIFAMRSFLSLFKAARRRRRRSHPAALKGGKTTGQLLHESTIEPVPSVTERTTELLAVERKTTNSRQG